MSSKGTPFWARVCATTLYMRSTMVRAYNMYVVTKCASVLNLASFRHALYQWPCENRTREREREKRVKAQACLWDKGGRADSSQVALFVWSSFLPVPDKQVQPLFEDEAFSEICSEHFRMIGPRWWLLAMKKSSHHVHSMLSAVERLFILAIHPSPLDDVWRNQIALKVCRKRFG